MNDKSFKEKILGGFAWKLAEKVGVQLVQFVIQIILARLLLPEEYGIVGLLTIFITISDVFIQQGFTTALIQKKNTDELDCSSVYFANILMAVIIYIILFLAAPYVAIFYQNAQLTFFMRVLSINVIIGAFAAVHNALLAKALDFRKSFIRNAFNVITQGLVGIVSAYMGLGAWSLVISKVMGTFVGTLVLCFTVKWKPIFKFSFTRVKALFKFSSKVLITNLLNTIFNNIHSLIIGRYYTSSILGYYQKGQQIPQAFMVAFDGSFSDVLYPALSSVQEQREYLKTTLRRSIKSSMFIVLPALMGLIAVAESLTIVLLTEKWLPCVTYMQLQCIICMFWPLSARTHALNAIGKSDVTLKLSIIGKAMTVIVIILCIKQGIHAIMSGAIVTSVINLIISSYFVKKYIYYSFKELLEDLMPTFFIACIMFIVVVGVGGIDVNIYLKLVAQIVLGIIVYVCSAALLKIDTFVYVFDRVKKRILKKE